MSEQIEKKLKDLFNILHILSDYKRENIPINLDSVMNTLKSEINKNNKNENHKYYLKIALYKNIKEINIDLHEKYENGSLQAIISIRYNNCGEAPIVKIKDVSITTIDKTTKITQRRIYLQPKKKKKKSIIQKRETLNNDIKSNIIFFLAYLETYPK